MVRLTKRPLVSHQRWVENKKRMQNKNELRATPGQGVSQFRKSIMTKYVLHPSQQAPTLLKLDLPEMITTDQPPVPTAAFLRRKSGVLLPGFRTCEGVRPTMA